MKNDLANLVGAIGAAGVDPTGVVFVTGPREATLIKATVGPKLDNLVLETLGLPAKAVCAFAPAGIFSGYQDQPEIEASKDAVVHFEEDTPTDISTSGTAVAYPSKSAYQSDLIIIRVRANCAWAARPGAAQFVSSVTW